MVLGFGEVDGGGADGGLSGGIAGVVGLDAEGGVGGGRGVGGDGALLRGGPGADDVHIPGGLAQGAVLVGNRVEGDAVGAEVFDALGADEVGPGDIGQLYAGEEEGRGELGGRAVVGSIAADGGGATGPGHSR